MGGRSALKVLATVCSLCHYVGTCISPSESISTMHHSGPFDASHRVLVWGRCRE